MTARYSVTIEGRVRTVEIEPGEGSEMRVVIDGQRRVLDVRPFGAGGGGGGGAAWSIVEGASSRLIQVDGRGERLTVEVSHPDGEPRICGVEIIEARPGDGGVVPAAATGPVTVRAPIPGRVVKLVVKPGDAVKAGQALLVLEAMKMENELRAPRAGEVVSVHAAEGATVDAGQALVVLG